MECSKIWPMMGLSVLSVQSYGKNNGSTHVTKHISRICGATKFYLLDLPKHFIDSRCFRWTFKRQRLLGLEHGWKRWIQTNVNIHIFTYKNVGMPRFYIFHQYDPHYINQTSQIDFRFLLYCTKV